MLSDDANNAALIIHAAVVIYIMLLRCDELCSVMMHIMLLPY